MGEQFLGNLTNALRTVSVSRKRALQLISGAVAVAVPAASHQVAEARKHRQPPLAFVAGALVDAGPGGSTGSFDWTFHGVVMTEVGSQFKLDTFVVLSATATTDQVRKQAVPQLRSKAATALQNANLPVTEDRIAVTLL